MFIFNLTSKKTYIVEILEQLQRNIAEIYDNIVQPTKFNQTIDQSSNYRRMKWAVDDSGGSECVLSLGKLKDAD